RIGERQRVGWWHGWRSSRRNGLRSLFHRPYEGQGYGRFWRRLPRRRVVRCLLGYHNDQAESRSLRRGRPHRHAAEIGFASRLRSERLGPEPQHQNRLALLACQSAATAVRRQIMPHSLAKTFATVGVACTLATAAQASVT